MTENTNVLPAVARNINLPCKKCATDRFFVVVAHTSETSAKVKCEVCGAQKTYKLPSEKKAAAKKPKAAGAKTPGAKGGRGRRGPDPLEIWTALREKHGGAPSASYTMRAKFQNNQVIEHPKFGVGFVTGVQPSQIEVVFQEGSRQLVHNRP